MTDFVKENYQVICEPVCNAKLAGLYYRATKSQVIVVTYNLTGAGEG
jgi:hypothetical protein